MKKYIEYFIILIFVLNSGGFFYTTKHSTIFTCLLILSLLLFYRFTVSKYNLYTFAVFVVLVILNSLMNYNYLVDYNKIISLIGRATVCLILVSNMTIEKFKKYYVNILMYICIISLICFSIVNMLPNYKFPMSMVENVGNFSFIYTPYYMFFFPGRNPGLFWEPGVFQVFINLSIIFLINTEKNVKILAPKFILFFITLLTTKSTTGYIIFFILIIYMLYMLFSKNVVSMLKNKKLRNIAIFAIAMSICAFSYAAVKSSVIKGKFQNSNASYSIRKNDLYSSLKIIKSRPITGFGYWSDKSKDMEYNYNIVNNSNGLLFFTYMLGVPIALIYIITYYRGVKRFFPEINSYYIFLVFIIIFMTEYLMLHLMFLSIIFKWKSEEDNIKTFSIDNKNFFTNFIKVIE